MSDKFTHDTYNYCQICGRWPESPDAGYVDPVDVAPNRDPIRWWDVDDGWKIGALCPSCIEDYGDEKPNMEDYAFATTNGIADVVDTEHDYGHLLEDLA